MSQPENLSSQPQLLYVNPFHFESGVPLTHANFHLVKGFTCGQAGQTETAFEQDVSNWIQSEIDGALAFVTTGEGDVRLFLHDDGRLIGYGAICQVEWVIQGQAHDFWLIHFAGIHTQFRGQKGVPPAERFGRRLLGGLIEEIERRGGCEFMALYVDPVNPARKLYEEFGFVEVDIEEDGDRNWVRMIRRLQSPMTTH